MGIDKYETLIERIADKYQKPYDTVKHDVQHLEALARIRNGSDKTYFLYCIGKINERYARPHHEHIGED